MEGEEQNKIIEEVDSNLIENALNRMMPPQVDMEAKLKEHFGIEEK